MGIPRFFYVLKASFRHVADEKKRYLTMMQPLEKEIWQLVEPGVEDMGLRMVRVRFNGGAHQGVLQLMIEPVECSKDNPVSATVDQCADVSRMASALLDVEDTIKSRYTLEVSSTGMERPLVSVEDFKNYTGCRIKAQMAVPFENRRKFIGMLDGVEEGVASLTMDENGQSVSLPIEQMKFAHLFFTDEDIRQMMNTEE